MAALVSAKRLADDTIRHHQPRLTFKRLAELFIPVELVDERVVKVVVNIYTFADMRNDPSIHPHLDLTTSREVLSTGLMGTILNAGLYVNKKVPVGKVVVLSEKDDVDVGKDWSPSPDQLEDI